MSAPLLRRLHDRTGSVDMFELSVAAYNMIFQIPITTGSSTVFGNTQILLEQAVVVAVVVETTMLVLT